MAEVISLNFPKPQRRIRVGMLVGSVNVVGGGVSEVVRALATTMACLPGISVEVFSLLWEGQERLDFGDVPMHLARPSGPAAFGYSSGLSRLLLSSSIDVLHVHGLWMYPSVAAPRWARRTGKPYVVSPHGMLDPWALSSSNAKKRLARFMFEDANLEGAACIHALNDEEAKAIRAARVRTPVMVIPNGVDPIAASVRPAQWRREMPEDARVLVFLGRVTPKKQVLELVRAWARTRERRSPWHLVVVGPIDSDYAHALERTIAENVCRSHVHLVGPAYGPARASAYASADAFVLPSISEGLPMAALEAFAAGLPALLTPQCNLPQAFAEGCAFSVESGEGGIARGLLRLMNSSAGELAGMGRSARAFASARYSWDRVAADFADLYCNLALASEPRAGCLPAFVERISAGSGGLPEA